MCESVCVWVCINIFIIRQTCMSFVLREIFKCRTHLMLIKYWANATASGLPLIVIVLSVFPPSRSSQFEMRIMAPEIWRISAILVPPFPMMHPIKSFGTVISCCCVLVCVLAVERNWEPASAARAVKKKHRGLAFELFFYFVHIKRTCFDSSHQFWRLWSPLWCFFLYTKFGNYSYWYLSDSIHQYL